VELKNNVKRRVAGHGPGTRRHRGPRPGIIMAPQVWVTSGHVANFSDPLVECTTSGRFRLDELPGAEDLTNTELADPTVVDRSASGAPWTRPAVGPRGAST